MKPMRIFSVKPPLTDRQRADVLRLFADWEAQARYSLEVELVAAAGAARKAARAASEGVQREVLKAEAGAYESAIAMLAQSWPTAALRGIALGDPSALVELHPTDQPTPDRGTPVRYHGTSLEHHGVWEVLGVAEHGFAERHGLSDRITHAGTNVTLLFPNPEEYDPERRPNPAHVTRTWQNSYEPVWRPRPNGRDTVQPDPASSWKCSCGAYGGGATREEARAAARRHREQADQAGE